MFTFRKVAMLLIVASALSTAVMLRVAAPAAARDDYRTHQVVVPGEDRFTSFAITIRQGDSVFWVNRDTDDHTVVSDDFVNTTDNRGTNRMLVGTDKNGGKPGTVRLEFNRPGTFVYYCRFHSMLDGAHQPVAPGPDGGIQTNGNFGTPMMGVITVLPDR